MRWLIALVLFGVSQETTLAPYAKLAPPEINEMSGIVKSRRWPNTYWVHNDSGDKGRIFAIHADGSLIREVAIEGAGNVDWEDLAYDGRNLYISDLGNNGNSRRDLAIYVVPEPSGNVAKATKMSVRYEDQNEFPPEKRHFDCEALFVLRGDLFAITKHRSGPLFPGTSANLYRLDKRAGLLRRVDTAELGGWVTGADVSPSGRFLAALVQAPQQSVWIFETGAPGYKFFSDGKGREIRLKGLKQDEAICWQDEKTLLIGNEQGELFRLSL